MTKGMDLRNISDVSAQILLEYPLIVIYFYTMSKEMNAMTKSVMAKRLSMMFSALRRHFIMFRETAWA